MIYHGHSACKQGVPPHLINKALDKWSSLFVRNQNMFVDKNYVYVLTSYFEAAHCKEKKTLGWRISTILLQATAY